MSESPTRVCEACRHWDRLYPDAQIGRCRRHAPQPGRPGTGWPETDNDDWCGEWETSTPLKWLRASRTGQKP
jgi:hypothetical protein